MSTKKQSNSIPLITSSTSIPVQVLSAPAPDQINSTPNELILTPDQITSTPNQANWNLLPPPTSDSSSLSYHEPAWCWEADTIQFSVFDSYEEASTAIDNLIKLLAEDDITNTNRFDLRGRILLYLTFEALPSDVHQTIPARYIV